MAKKRTLDQIAEGRNKLAQELRKQPDEFVDCRDVQHAWVETTTFRPYLVEGQQGVSRKQVSPLIHRLLECSRCGTERHDIFYARTFEKLQTRYTYPDNYQIPGVPRGAKPSTIIRAEKYRRAMQEIEGSGKALISAADS